MLTTNVSKKGEKAPFSFNSDSYTSLTLLMPGATTPQRKIHFKYPTAPFGTFPPLNLLRAKPLYNKPLHQYFEIQLVNCSQFQQQVCDGERRAGSPT